MQKGNVQNFILLFQNFIQSNKLIIAQIAVQLFHLTKAISTMLPFNYDFNQIVCTLQYIKCVKYIEILVLCMVIKLNLSEVESRTQGSRLRTQKKSEANDSLSEDRPSQGQEQECSRPRPRTKDTATSVLPKKRSSKKLFRRSPIRRRTQDF